MYNKKVITVKDHELMLVPLQQCMGVDFGNVKRKPVSYKMRDYMVMDWNVENCQRIANVGVQIEGPALFDYDWPGKFVPFDHQRVTFNFMINNKRSFIFNDIGCVSGDTEYLTPTGWKRIDEYVEGDVGQYHPDTGQVSLTKPDAYVVRDCDHMYHFKTKYGIDQMLSAEHRVLYKGSTGKFAVKSAHEIAQRHADSKMGFSGRFMTTFEITGRKGLPMSDAELQLQVAVIADSHIPNKTNRCVINIKKERKKLRLVKLLDACGVEYHRNNRDTGFSVFSFLAPRREKEFTDFYYDANPRQLKLLADESTYWDGTFRKCGAREFFSTSKKSVDFIQYAFAATGRTASLNKQVENVGGRSDVYMVHARKGSSELTLKGVLKDGTANKDSIKVVPTEDGKKYCFMTPSKFLILRRNGKIFATGNTSKTITALWAADYLMKAGKIKKVLITSTLSTLDRVWYNEIFTHLMHRNCTVMHGSMQKKRRLKLLAEDHDFYIINHDGMKGMVEALADKKFDMIIVDEGAVFRNHKTDLWKALNYIACEEKLEWLYWMTGSPMPRAPTDVWAQAKIVKPGTVPKYFSRFREDTMFKINLFKWVPRKGWEDTVYSSIQPSIRFHRDDCVDIPSCTYVDHKVEMSKEQKEIYAGLKDHFIAEAKQGLVTAANEGVKLVKLLQVACGAIYHEDGEVSPVDCGPKFKELESICEEAGDKLILFVPFKHTIIEIEKWFKKKLPKSTYGIINGGVGKTARDIIFDEFQTGNLNIILAHPKAMAHGLTLTAANVITWWGPVDDFEIYEQANGRITRPGQERKQYIKHLTCSPVEESVYQRLKNKESMQGIILDMIKK